MPFCPRCGKEVPEEANYCPYCGLEVRVEVGWEAGTGLDTLMADSRVRGNWLSRVVAYVIDSIVVGVAAIVVGWLLTLPLLFGPLLRGSWWTWRGFIGLPLPLGVVQVLYFTLMEGGYGASIGKQAMGLEVVDELGRPPTLSKALIRNMSKVYWALLLLDIFMGLISRFDPRQKYTDRIAGTKVVRIGGNHLGLRPGPPTHRPEMHALPRPMRKREPLGWVNVGVFLVIVATVFILYPGVLAEIIAWLRGWGETGPTMIPGALIAPLTWFLTALGVWSLALAAIRAASGINRLNGISDASGGLFMLAAAYLLNEYASGLLTLSLLLPTLVIALGAHILLASAASYMLHDRLRPKA